MAEALAEQPCIEVSNSLDRPLLHDLEEAGADDTSPEPSPSPASGPSCKRLRCSEAMPPSPVKRYKSLGMQLYVRMDTVSGRSRMHNLSLRRVQDVHCLEVGLQPRSRLTVTQPAADGNWVFSNARYKRMAGSSVCKAAPHRGLCMLSEVDGMRAPFATGQHITPTAQQHSQQRAFTSWACLGRSRVVWCMCTHPLAGLLL